MLRCLHLYIMHIFLLNDIEFNCRCKGNIIEKGLSIERSDRSESLNQQSAVARVSNENKGVSCLPLNMFPLFVLCNLQIVGEHYLSNSEMLKCLITINHFW